MSAPGVEGCLLQGGGGVCSRGCLLRGGVCSEGCLLLGGGCGIPACTEADTPPVNRMTNRCKKYYLGHNFVAAGKNRCSTWIVIMSDFPLNCYVMLFLTIFSFRVLLKSFSVIKTCSSCFMLRGVDIVSGPSPTFRTQLTKQLTNILLH